MKDDRYYRERADRQRTTLLAAVLLIALLGCVSGVIFTALRDGCTDSFDREPRLVVESYLQAFAAGDLAAAERCWAREAYYVVESGCSEICMSRNLGRDFTMEEVELEPVIEAGTDRARMEAVVRVRCSTGAVEVGRLTLDSIWAEVPWKHWRLVSSTVGGTVVEPWCEESQPIQD